MKLVWKLSIPQICIVVCLGLISFAVVNSSFTNMREQYIRNVIESRFQFITKEIENSARKSVSESSVFVRLPAVIQAYEIALSGDIDDPYSPESQAARELLRKELALMLDSYREVMGLSLQLHFHLPNGFSLVRLWRDKNTRINGEWVDISDDLRSYRPTVLDVNKSGKPAIGLEPGSGGFTIRGVIPVTTPGGRLIGSAEVLQDFNPILESAREEGQFYISLYANSELLDFSVELQNPEKYPLKGDFVRVVEAKDSTVESLITPDLLTKGKKSAFFEDYGSMTVAMFPIANYQGNQVGVIVLAMNTKTISILLNTTAITMVLILVGMAIAPTFALLLRLRILVTGQMNMIKAKIQDIAEDRADLSEQIPSHQKDEIGELVRWFNTLTAKLDGILKERQAMFSKIRSESDKFKETAHWYASILDAIPFIISVQDTEMKWTFINKTVEKLFGKKREDIIGLHCSSWGSSICDTDNCAVVCAKHGVKRTFFTQDGGTYQADVEMFKNLDGEVAGFIEIVQDITKIKEMEEEALSASRAKSQFLANMSHEIRTPMNAIIGMTELALREDEIGAVRGHIHMVKQASANLLSLINDILDFSKIERGKLEIIQGDYSLSSLINEVVNIIRTRAFDSQICFVVNLDSSIPNMLFGDEIRIRQVLLNLLSNAVKFTENGFVSFDVTGKIIDDSAINLLIDVKDSGIGIKQGDIEQIFGAYKQMDLEKNRNIEGTGLGLAITQSIVKMMGGDISVYSEYGKGSTFTLMLPQKISSPEALAFVENADAKSVLVYENRDIYGNSIINTMKNLGVRCASVVTDSEFYDQIATNQWSFVFVEAKLYENIERIYTKIGFWPKTVLLTDFGEAVSDSNYIILPMPVYSLPIANVLNGASGVFYSENNESIIKFTAPAAKVLIVDDINTNLKVAEGLLMPYKMQIDLRKSGAEAIEAIQTKRYDLVFMDHKMPEMDGIEATLYIRAMGDAEPFYKNVPIVALTANAVFGMREIFMENGFNDFLSKPIDTMALHSILKKWIPKDKQKDQAAAAIKDPGSGKHIVIEGLDYNKGILRSGGNVELYLETLAVFYQDASERINKIGDCLKTGDLRLYTTYIHALKSAVANIGADELSESAKELEMAGVQGDLPYVETHNEIFLAGLKALLNNIDHALSSQYQEERKDLFDTELFNAELVKLKIALENMDAAAMNRAIEKLQKMAQTEDIAVVRNMSKNILIAEYGDAISLTQALLRKHCL